MSGISTALRKASLEAAKRQKRREQLEEEARLEELRAATDPFFADLTRAIKTKGRATYGLGEREYWFNEKDKKWQISKEDGVAAFLIAECQRLGLQAEVEVDSDIVGYSVRRSGCIVVTRQ